MKRLLSVFSALILAPTAVLAQPLSGAAGGTGVANTGKTITLGGNLTTSGAFSTTLTETGNTNVTLPTSGTLATATTPLVNGNVALQTTTGVMDSGVAPITSAGAGTLWGNPTAAAALPTFTLTPVLGVSGTSTGTLALANGGASGKQATIQNNSATAANYNFNLPATAGSSGNFLTSGGGGSSPMTWTSTVAKGSGGTGGTTGRAAGANLSLPYILSNDSTASSALTGTTSETILKWINVPANSLGANGCVNLGTLWQMTGTNNVWIRVIRVIAGTVNGTTGGTAVMTDTIGAGLNGRGDELLCNNGVTNAQYLFTNGPNPFGFSSNGFAPSAIDTTSAWTISLNARLNSGSDSLVLKHAHSLLITAGGN